MSAPTIPGTTQPMVPELALRPIQGDWELVMRLPGQEWIAIIPVPHRILSDGELVHLVHLAPILTQVPDDIVAQFARELGLDDE